MGNLCKFKSLEPIETSFSDIVPKIKTKETNQTNFLTQKEENNKQLNQSQFPVMKNKVSSRVQSVYSISGISQPKGFQKAVIVPPSECEYDKIQSLQMLSQVPSQFFNKCNMSTFFKTGNPKLNQSSLAFSFKNGKTQSKISRIQKDDDISPINYFLKSENNRNNNMDEEQHLRVSKSEMKQTTSTKLSDIKHQITNKSAIPTPKKPKQSTLNFNQNPLFNGSI